MMKWIATPLIMLVFFFPYQGSCRCLLFNFGDSNSDTGSSLAMVGGGSDYEGRLFFHRPTGRMCDGRLIIDFLCQNASHPLLSPYMRAFDGDFQNGVNFAYSGARAMKTDCFLPPYSICNLPDQMQHFKSFRSLIKSDIGCKIQINKQEYENAVYMFDIGQNDLASTLPDGAAYILENSIAVIPPVLAEIKTSIETLYREIGARKFWVHNTGPLGCLLTSGAGLKGPYWKLDDLGCVTVPNDASKELNVQLHKLVEELRTSLPRSTIVYVDIYSIKHELFLNHTKYGFEHPLGKCTDDPACLNGAKYIIWDGTHYTELANSMVASKILTGDYSDPPVKFADFCNTLCMT